MTYTLTKQQMTELFLSNRKQDFRLFMEQFEKPDPIKYKLNVEATQFTIGKTSKTLMDVAKNATKLHLLHAGENNDPTADHIISIIITSCNLAETDQMFVRCKNKFRRKLNICTISSKEKNKNNGSGKSINHFISTLCTSSRKTCPDILLMCCHSQRISNDIIKLMEAQHNLMMNEGARAFRFKFNIFIDEADKNIKLVANSLNTILQRRLDINTIKEVNFITATPSKKFWKTLRKINITELDNFDFGCEISKEQREEALRKYRSILTQEFIDYQTPLFIDTLSYIKKVIVESGIIDSNKRNIVFAPAKNSIKDHVDIANWFINNGWWVFLHNGRFKGFISPLNEKFTVKDLKIKYNMSESTELRDVFVEWNKRHSNSSLAITGYSTITRGITFCTTGFNFTHMIFSAAHTKNLAEFVQLLGRCCGHEKYCDNIKIIGFKEAMEEAKQFVKNILELKSEDLERYNADNFDISSQNDTVMCEKYKTPEEACTKLKEIFGSATNPIRIRPSFKNKTRNITDTGLYKNNLRGNTDVMSYEYIYNNRSWGIGVHKLYRTHICYENTSDPETICYVICYPKSRIIPNVSNDDEMKIDI